MRALLTALLLLAGLAAQQVPEGLSTSDWSGIRAAYDAGRHRVWSHDGWHVARSPHQQWTVRFDGRGAVVSPDTGDWTWGIRLASFGFAGAECEAGAPQSAHVVGQRLTYRWTDALDEWHVNGARGLEHGFTVHRRPGAGDTLTFLLCVSGDLEPVVRNGGRDVGFERDGTTMLDYAGLHVFDADGVPLAASFSVQPRGLLLSIDERGARYPITVDPIAQHAYLKASNTEANDRFGNAVAVTGDTVVVGAPGEDSAATGVNGNQASNAAPDAGAAYVFVRAGSTWTQQAYLKASNTGPNDQFGFAVAASGDTVVVSAYGEDSAATGVNGNQADDSAASSGAVYVFVRSGTSWTQQAYLKASNTGALDAFGCSLSMSGDTVAVGACGEDSSASGVNGNQADNGAFDAGAVYVFVRNGSTWSQQAYLKASNTGGSDRFGWSIASTGDTVAVGAVWEDSNAVGVGGNQASNSAANSGAAYVFVRSGSTWSQQAYLKASNTGVNDFFGIAIGAADETIVVGASGEASSATGVDGNQTDNSAFTSGAAYVFVRSGSTWSQQAYLKASNTGLNDQFGSAVAVSGDVAVIGSALEDSASTGVNGVQSDNSASSSGAAYVFVRNGVTWDHQAYLKAANSEAGDQFGWSVAVSDDLVVIGADVEDSSATGVNGSPFDNGASGAGAVSVFDLRSGGLGSIPAPAQQAYLKASNTDMLDHFGHAVAVSGDTVVVGAPFEASAATGVGGNQADNSAAGAGAAYVFVRTGGGWSQQAYLKASNTDAGDLFGSSVAASGDTIVVGAIFEGSAATGVGGNQADNSAVAAGAAYVFVRNGGGWSQQAYLKATNTDAGDLFGWSIAVSGDTVVVGAVNEGSDATGINGNQTSNAVPAAGAAYVFVRGGSVWVPQAYLKASNTDAGDQFGFAVGASGDTVVVGAVAEASSATGVNGNQANNSALAAGAAYVFARGGSGWTQQGYLKASNTGAGDQFGRSVAVSGGTVVVGAAEEASSAFGVDGNQADNSAVAAGAAYVFARNGATWSQQAYLKASNTDAGDRFGWSVAVSGDTVVVGAVDEASNAFGVDGNQDDDSAPSAGAAYLFSRCGSTWTQRSYLKGPITDAGDQFGFCVAVSGDTAVIGARGEDGNATGVNGNPADNSATTAGAANTFSIERVRPSLWPSNAPQIGQNHTLAIDGIHPAFNLAILVFGFTQFPLPGVDLGFVGMSCCDLHGSLDIFIPANPGGGGSAAWTWMPVVGSPGDTFYCQALCLDPAANGLGLTISNQIRITLVP